MPLHADRLGPEQDVLLLPGRSALLPRVDAELRRRQSRSRGFPRVREAPAKWSAMDRAGPSGRQDPYFGLRGKPEPSLPVFALRASPGTLRLCHRMAAPREAKGEAW